MGKQSGLIQRATAVYNTAFADGQLCGQQQTFDAVMIYLHRNGWGAQRILKLHKGIHDIMDEYSGAFCVGMEQDVLQERTDREIMDALKDAAPFSAFSERYPNVRTAGYERMPKRNG